MKYATLCHTLILRTEHKVDSNEKVKSLEGAVENGAWNAVPVMAVVQHPYMNGRFLVYSGNSRHYVAEKHNLSMRVRIMEDDADLEMVRADEQEVYWPGAGLRSVISTLLSWRQINITNRTGCRPGKQYTIEHLPRHLSGCLARVYY